MSQTIGFILSMPIMSSGILFGDEQATAKMQVNIIPNSCFIYYFNSVRYLAILLTSILPSSSVAFDLPGPSI